MICGKEWDINDAKVACRSMGLPEATRAFNQSEFGSPRRVGIKMKQIRCTGDETSLSECPNDGFNWNSKRACSSAGVLCGPPKGTKKI